MNGNNIKEAIISRLKSEGKLLTDVNIINELKRLSDRDIRHIEITGKLEQTPALSIVNRND